MSLATSVPAGPFTRPPLDPIRSAVQVRLGTNDLPLNAEVRLQTVIREWDRSRQTQPLQTKLAQLESARLRLAPDFVPLADSYRRVIEAYLREPEESGFFLFRKKGVRPEAIDQTLKDLDALDSRRAALQPKPKPTVAVQAGTQ